jgi:hypothetical protein
MSREEAYPGSRGSLRGEINERREGRASGIRVEEALYLIKFIFISILYIKVHPNGPFPL